MLKMVNEIKQAQDYLRGNYGEEGYEKRIHAFRNYARMVRQQAPDVSELDVINYVIESKELPADVKLVALSYLGEKGA